MDSRGGAVRRLMVTLLEVGSGDVPRPGRGGVCGGAEPAVEGDVSSTDDMESDVVSKAATVSTDLLREPRRETRWRLREEEPLSWSKGFGRVEQGSEEAARSRGNAGGSGSIGPNAARRPAVEEGGGRGGGGGGGHGQCSTAEGPQGPRSTTPSSQLHNSTAQKVNSSTASLTPQKDDDGGSHMRMDWRCIPTQRWRPAKDVKIEMRLKVKLLL
jgi:hypothetical protein